jgi:hypothetical protein
LNEELYISLVGECFDGYSEVFLNNKPVYIKHINIRDQRYLHKYYERYKKIALDKGVYCEKDKLKLLKDDGIWEEKDDAEISSLESEVKNLAATAKAVFLPSQKELINEQRLDAEKKLLILKDKRKEVVGKTAEDYALAMSNDEILRFLLFKDESLKENLFTEEEFEELDGSDVVKINNLQKSVQKKLDDTQIQKAVLRPFFSMYLPLCENAGDFYRKPITELTVFQLRVVLYGRIFHSIFQNVENIPDNIREDPEKLLSFSDQSRNKNSRSGGIDEDSDASAVFGATKEDMEKIRGNGKTVSLAEEAEKHGGKLNMEQMMRLAGHDV